MQNVALYECGVWVPILRDDNTTSFQDTILGARAADARNSASMLWAQRIAQKEGKSTLEISVCAVRFP